MDPPVSVSVPVPPKIIPAAMAAAVPLLEPEVKCFVFQGFFAGGGRAGRRTDPEAPLQTRELTCGFIISVGQRLGPSGLPADGPVFRPAFAMSFHSEAPERARVRG